MFCGYLVFIEKDTTVHIVIHSHAQMVLRYGNRPWGYTRKAAQEGCILNAVIPNLTAPRNPRVVIKIPKARPFPKTSSIRNSGHGI